LVARWNHEGKFVTTESYRYVGDSHLKGSAVKDSSERNEVLVDPFLRPVAIGSSGVLTIKEYKPLRPHHCLVDERSAYRGIEYIFKIHPGETVGLKV